MTDFTTIPLKAAAPLPRRQWLKSTLLSGTGVSVAAALSVPLQACGGTDSCEDESMKGFPDFFNQAPVMRVRDRLAEFLGAAEGGVMDYHYVDAVRLAGHSCPTVAGAYLMTVKGMRALYGSDMPERGNIDVLMSDGREEGVTGVIASIATLLTGAAAETGFPGMGACGALRAQEPVELWPQTRSRPSPASPRHGPRRAREAGRQHYPVVGGNAHADATRCLWPG